MCYTGLEHALMEGQQERVVRPEMLGRAVIPRRQGCNRVVYMQGKLWQPIALHTGVTSAPASAAVIKFLIHLVAVSAMEFGHQTFLIWLEF